MRPTVHSWLAGLAFSAVLLVPAMRGVTKLHVITFGKWISVPWIQSSSQHDKPFTLKIRALVIDGRVKEYVLGSPHDVTDRLFVVRQAFRVNDSLPEESSPHWLWQRGGWLVVDRITGRVSPLNLPDFDWFYSAASWYRDYVAYCGVSDDGRKVLTVVAQIGRRKAVLSRTLSTDGLPDDAPPDSACSAPIWQRSPTRVSFEANGTRQTFSVRGHVVDLANDSEEEEGSR